MNADPNTYLCRDDHQNKWIFALRINWILYLILACLSVLSIIAGPIVKVRAIKGCLTAVFGILHLICLIWTAIIRFNEAGEMCMITAEDQLVKEHAKFRERGMLEYRDDDNEIVLERRGTKERAPSDREGSNLISMERWEA